LAFPAECSGKTAPSEGMPPSARGPFRVDALCPAAKPGDDPRVPRPEDADVQRILSQYKRLVLLGKAKLPLAEGRRLVGPDTAFHLYFRHAEVAAPRRRRRRSAGRGRR